MSFGLALVLLTLVCMVTYSFEITFALAGTILMLMVMSFFYEAKTLVIYSVMPQILVGSIGLIRSPRKTQLKQLFYMWLFAAVGSVIGIYIFYQTSVEIFQYSLATVVTLFGLFMVSTSSQLRIPKKLAHVLDTLAGFSQALFGISGPIAMPRMMATFEDRILVRLYALAFFLGLNLFRMGSYLIEGTIDFEIGYMMLVSGPFIAMALWYASHLHLKVNERVFRRVVSWTVLAGGLSLFAH